MPTSHVLVCDSGPSHAAPPWAASMNFARSRVVSPSSQEVLQDVQGCHESHSQFTGHASVLHSTSCDLTTSHMEPPFDGAVTTFFTSVATPPPQETSHSEAGTQLESSQSTGHGSMLHGTFFSRLLGHAAAPCAAAVVIVRTISCSPPPQLREHSPCSSQALTTQSTGQGVSSQSIFSISAPSQTLPPNWARTARSRVRWVSPMPQAALQEPQTFQSSQTQSMGQSRSWQTWASRSTPSASLPPCATITTWLRVLEVVPSPHQAEQPPHPVH